MSTPSSIWQRLSSPPWSTALKGLLAAGLVVYLAFFVEVGAILEAARHAHPGWIAAAAALLPLNVWLEGETWRHVMRPARRLTRREAFGALLAGFALGLFTPARTGDFVGRAFSLEHPDGWTTSLTIFVQRLMDMAAALAGGALAFGLALWMGWLPAGWWPLGLAGAAVATVIAAFLAAPRRAVRLARRLVSSRQILDRLSYLERLRPSDLVPAAACAAARYGVYLTQLVLLVRAFVPGDAAFDTARAFGAGGSMYLGKFLVPSVTLMDLGVREGFAVFFFGRVGLAEAAAFNASLLLFALNLVVPAALGAPFLLRLRMRRRASAPETDADA